MIEHKNSSFTISEVPCGVEKVAVKSETVVGNRDV
jgi:hypothetical protein